MLYLSSNCVLHCVVNMQTIVCIFLLLTVSVAEDVDIYVYNNMESYKMKNSPTESIMPPHPFEFGYHLDDRLNMLVVLKNKSESVSVEVQLLHYEGRNIITENSASFNEKENYFKIHHQLNAPKIIILLQLNVGAYMCSRKKIINANTTHDDSKYYDICLNPEPCVVVVDLSSSVCSVPDMPTNTPRASIPVATSTKGINNEIKKEKKEEEITSRNISTEIDTNHKVTEPKEPFQGKVLIYVIPSVVVMCVITLVVYMRVKKNHYRNRQPEEIIQLNTYATANEVLYADLSLELGNNPPPVRDQSPYAQIIGVMKPVPSCKLRNKKMTNARRNATNYRLNRA